MTKSEPNYVKELARLHSAGVLRPDDLTFIDVAHDDWCVIYQGPSRNDQKPYAGLNSNNPKKLRPSVVSVGGRVFAPIAKGSGIRNFTFVTIADTDGGSITKGPESDVPLRLNMDTEGFFHCSAYPEFGQNRPPLISPILESPHFLPHPSTLGLPTLLGIKKSD